MYKRNAKIFLHISTFNNKIIIRYFQLHILNFQNVISCAILRL